MNIQRAQSNALTRPMQRPPVFNGGNSRFTALLRGGFTNPNAGGSVAPPSQNGRGIPAAMQQASGPQIVEQASGMNPTTRASNSEAFARLDQNATNELWYGGTRAHGAQVDGVYSEKATFNGIVGMGHEKFATVADGGDMAIVVNGLRGKPCKETRVMALDADAVMQANGGKWPDTPQEMKALIERNPDLVVSDVKMSPPEALRLQGVEKGKRIVTMVGAEGLFANPPVRPQPAQAMITNVSQLPEKMQAMLPEQGIMANSASMKMAMQMQAQMMVDNAMEQAARNMAEAASERIAADTAIKNAEKAAAASVANSATNSSEGASVQGPDSGKSA